MRWFPVAVACAALCVGAPYARAADDEQDAKDQAFERAAAAEASDAQKAGLPVTAETSDALAGIEARRAEKQRPPPRWGLLVAGGFPEGLAASVVFRPVSEVRLSAGPMWNYVGWGVQAGVTLIPWHMGVSPLLSLEAGRYFSADAAFLAKSSSGVPEEVKPLLTNVAYDYASAHVGIEIGTRDAFAISIRAGLSYVSMVANGTATTYVNTGGTTATVAFTDPHLRGTIPSANVGVQLWF